MSPTVVRQVFFRFWGELRCVSFERTSERERERVREQRRRLRAVALKETTTSRKATRAGRFAPFDRERGGKPRRKKSKGKTRFNAQIQGARALSFSFQMHSLATMRRPASST